MTQGLNDLFGSKDTILDEVVILGVGAYTSGTYSLPAGYTWTDFEYIEVVGGATDGLFINYDSTTISKREIAENPTNWQVRTAWTNGASAYAMRVAADNETDITITELGNSSTQSIKSIIGYTKRYATRNLSKIIDVGTVTVNTRYEIDIATELGSDYVGRDLVVVAEVYADGTNTQYSGWGEAEYAFFQNTGGTNLTYGAKGTVFNDKIVIQTGNTSLITGAELQGGPWGTTSAGTPSAPCRVKVWKIDQYVTPTSQGGAGKTVLYDGTLMGNGDTVILNDDITKYDEIKIYGASTTTNSWSVSFEPDELLGRTECFFISYLSTVWAYVNNATSTSLPIVSVDTSTGIYKVVGINY